MGLIISRTTNNINKERVKNKRRKILIGLLAIIGFFFVFFYFGNNAITITEIEYKNEKIPEGFNDYKILQISDLHNKEFGNNQWRILNKVEEINPDIIVITGDLIDLNRTDMEVAMDLVNGVVNIAPTYYVSGNHEAIDSLYEPLKEELIDSGVIVLDNEKIEISSGNDTIELLGLSDLGFKDIELIIARGYGSINDDLNDLVQGSNSFKILLSHRPELFDVYVENDVDLVFAGHAHGGQVRIPFVGGLIAPDQGFFPELTEGIHTRENTSLVISRGLGNSVIPIRIFNRPELVVVNLYKK